MKAATETQTKTCAKCGETKPLEKFSLRNKRKGTRQCHCKECAAETSRAWREANHERKAETDRAWYEANRERAAETDRAWHEANRERKAETSRAWYEANRERKAEADRAWRKANPLKVKAKKARRRARERNLANDWTAQDAEFAWHWWNGCCAFCGFDLNDFITAMHMDHFKPLAKKGPTTVDNMLPACETCNCSKGDKAPGLWLEEKLGKRKARQVIERCEEYFEAAQARREESGE